MVSRKQPAGGMRTGNYTIPEAHNGSAPRFLVRSQTPCNVATLTLQDVGGVTNIIFQCFPTQDPGSEIPIFETESLDIRERREEREERREPR